MVEVSEAKKGLHVPDFGRSQPGSDATKFDWVHGELTRFHDHSEVLNFRNIELAFLKFKVEVKLGHVLKDTVSSFSVGGGVRGGNEEVIHVDDKPSFNDHVSE